MTQLTYALRELVWGLESEVAIVTSLSRRIDEHVTALNAARAELAERLRRLDAVLAAALRGLVDGIDQEVAAITALSEEIDDHVSALNDLRAQATERLLHLDELRAAAEDVNLSAFLDTTIAPQLPQIEEEFPDRIYGG